MPDNTNPGFVGRADPDAKLHRRNLLRSSLLAGGAWLTGLDKLAGRLFLETSSGSPLARGQLLGTIPFSGEAPVPMEDAFGAELDGRLYTDLSALHPDRPVIPTERFYIRTRASELLQAQKIWQVRVGGLTARPYALSMADLDGMAKP